MDYVYAALEKNSVHSLDYLRKNAATRYSYEEYVQALSQEYLPRSLEDLRSNVLAHDSQYDFTRIGTSINEYLTSNGLVDKPPPLPSPLLGQP